MAALSVAVLPIMATLTPRLLAILPLCSVAVLNIMAGSRRGLGRPGDRAARDGRARPGRLPCHAGGRALTLTLTLSLTFTLTLTLPLALTLTLTLPSPCRRAGGAQRDLLRPTRLRGDRRRDLPHRSHVPQLDDAP